MTDLNTPIAGQSSPAGYSHGIVVGTYNALPLFEQAVQLTTPIPAGSAVIGAVTQSGTWAVTVSGSVSITGALPAGTNVIGHVVVDSGSVNVGNFPASQAVTAVDGGIATLGAVADTAWTSGNGTVVALLKGVIAAIKGTLTTTISAGAALIGGVNLVDSAGTNKATISAGGAVKVDGSAATQPASIADGGAVTIGALADAAWVSGNGTVIAVLKAIVAAVKGTLNVSGPTLTYVDRSITITTGGTAQLVMSANASRKMMMVQNTSTNGGDVWISFTSTTPTPNGVGCYRLSALTGGYENPAAGASGQAVWAYAATTGQTISACEA